MKKQFTIAAMAAVLSLSTAPLALAGPLEWVSIQKNARDIAATNDRIGDLGKTTGYYTDAQGRLAGKDGNAIRGYDPDGFGYFKRDAEGRVTEYDHNDNPVKAEDDHIGLAEQNSRWEKENSVADRFGEVDRNLQGMDADIKNNRDNISNNTGAISANKDAIAENAKDISANKDAIDSNTDRLNGATGAFGKNSAFDTDDGRGNDGRNMTMEEAVNANRKELNQQQSINSTNQAAIEGLGQQGAEQNKRLDNAENRLGEHDKSLGEHEQRITQNTQNIAQNKAEADRRFAENESGIAQNRDAITELREDTEAGAQILGARLDGHREDINSNRDAIAANKSAIGKNAADIADNKELAEQQAKDAEANANTYTDGRIGSLGSKGDLYEVDSATGSFKRDADGKLVKQGSAKPVRERTVQTADAGGNDATVEDWVNQGKAAYKDANARINDLNGRFDTSMQQGKAYIDAAAQQSLKSANDYTDSRYNQLNSKMKKLRARADSGIAGATAIGSLTFDTLKPNSISGGLGIAKNKVAGAAGYQRNFNDKWRARATISVSDNYVQGGTSIGYSW